MKTSCNFKKTKHNSEEEQGRDFEAYYLLKKEDRKLNLKWSCGRSDKKVFEDELKKAKRKGGPTPKMENSLWEAVILTKGTETEEELKALGDKIAKKMNLIFTRFTTHRDEGHYINNIPHYNNHAHFNFCSYKEGVQHWRRELVTKEVLSEIQTLCAEHLNMERGTVGSDAVRLEHKQFRYVAKEKEKMQREHALQMQKLKEEYAKLEKELKELKAINSRLSIELIESKTLVIDLGAQVDKQKAMRIVPQTHKIEPQAQKEPFPDPKPSLEVKSDSMPLLERIEENSKRAQEILNKWNLEHAEKTTTPKL